VVPPSCPGVSSDTPVAPRWWELLGDPQLDALIARADASNQSLAAALGSARAAYAGVGASESERWPTVGLGAQCASTQTNVAQLASSGVNAERSAAGRAADRPLQPVVSPLVHPLNPTPHEPSHPARGSSRRHAHAATQAASPSPIHSGG
jgi:hypothetical protein